MQRYSHLLTVTCFLLSGYVDVFGQTETDRISQRVSDYSRSALIEKIYLHTDKQFYVAGDLLWFKAYSADGLYNKPLHLSQVLYVDILDVNNTPVLRTKLSLKEGSENGSLQLPLSMNSGNYHLRAYTAWMKNFPAQYFFEKTITIVNPLKSVDSLPSRMETKQVFALNFFPEGGQLVTGLESIVGFSFTNDKGSGEEGDGVILGTANDTVARFKTLRFGMGRFVFTPAAGQKYQAVLRLKDGSMIRKDLPQAFDLGYVMGVSETKEGSFQVVAHTNIKQAYQNVSVIVQTRGLLKYSDRTSFNNGTAAFTINRKNLGEGISQITLFVNDQPVCERLIFIRPQKGLELDLRTDKPQYASREKVNVSWNESNGKNPDLSLAVYRLDSLQNDEKTDIQSYLWLQSDLGGIIESAGYYFKDSSAEVKEATENLLLVQGWRRYRWEDILSGTKPFIRYSPELKGQIIMARITDTRTGQPAKNIEAFLSVPGNHFGLYLARTDSNGLARFDVQDYYGRSELLVQTNTINEPYYRIEIVSPFSDQHSPQRLPSFTLVPGTQSLLEQYSIGMQAQQVYTGDSLRRFDSPLINDTLPFFGKPGSSYMLDDYTRFTTMEEVLREYVREVNVEAKNGKLHMKIFNENLKDFFEKNMLVMLDGVPLPDADRIFSVDPMLIKKVEVVPRLYSYGPSLFGGVASFSSYKGDYELGELNPGLIRIDYEGLQLKREFYSPQYSTSALKSSRIPDFRTTLYWNPAPGKEVQFYTSDQKGKYLVVVEGLDENGKTVYTTSGFTVN